MKKKSGVELKLTKIPQNIAKAAYDDFHCHMRLDFC